MSSWGMNLSVIDVGRPPIIHTYGNTLGIYCLIRGVEYRTPYLYGFVGTVVSARQKHRLWTS